MSFTYLDTEEFARQVSPAESLPLALVRRAIHRWEWAKVDAASLAEASRAASQDARLARCAARADRDVEELALSAARAVQAWAGDDGPVLVVTDRGRLHADPGQETEGLRWVVVGPSEVGDPGSVATFDLAEAERVLVRRAITGVVADEEHRRRALALVDDRSSPSDHLGDHLGEGLTIARLARSLVWSSERLPRR